MQIYKIDSVTNYKVLDISKNEVIYLGTENKLSIDQSFFRENYGFKINKYEIGYYNVNVKILRHFLENTKSNWCLIYEKGVKIRENFNSIKEHLNMLPTETELVFTYHKLEENIYKKLKIVFRNFLFEWKVIIKFIRKDNCCISISCL